MGSLAQTGRAVAQGLREEWPDSDLVRLLAQAVNEFEAVPDADARVAYLAEPELIGDRVWDAALAALAVHLARMAAMDCTPAWTRRPERYSPVMSWVGMASDSGLAAYVFQRTPIYFKARGVMLDEANLVSV